MNNLTSDGSINIDHLFNHFFSVAEFQREYVWSDDDVNALLGDIWNSYKAGSDRDYFIGAIVLVDQDKKPYSIIDGQQRLTTIYLALCALKAAFERLNMDNTTIEGISKRLRDIHFDEQGRGINTIRITLNNPDSQKVIQAAFDNKIDETKSGDDSSENLREAFVACKDYFEKRFPDATGAGPFLVYLLQKVKLLPYVARSQKHAITVFETLNNRGVGLTPIDLVKSILFQKTKDDQWDDLQDKWKIFIGVLEETKETPKRFLKYFILTTLGVVQAEDDVYDYIQTNSKEIGIDADPFKFAEQLTSFAKSYACVISGRTANNDDAASISNLRKFAGRARQHFPFLIALKRFEKKLAAKCYEACESVLVAYAVQRMYTGDIERTFTDWTVTALGCADDAALQQFYDEKIRPHLAVIGAPALLKLMTVDETAIPRGKLKYLLCRLDSHLQLVAEPATEQYDRVDLYKGFDLEHILPLSMAGKGQKLAKWIPMFGNLTILERPLNRKIKDKLFAGKKRAYSDSKFILTKGIVQEPEKGNNRLVQAYRMVKRFDAWEPEDIKARQDHLCEMAAKIFCWTPA